MGCSAILKRSRQIKANSTFHQPHSMGWTTTNISRLQTTQMNLFNILSSNFSTVTLLILLRSFSSSQVQVVVSAQGNFCGTSWVDAVTTCQRPCPSGAPSDCGGGETCFANTPVSLLRGCVVGIMFVGIVMTIFCKEIMRCALFFFAINLMLPFPYHPIN